MPTNQEKDIRAACSLGVALRCSEDALHRGLEIAKAIEQRNPSADLSPKIVEIRTRVRDLVECLERFAEP